MSETRDPETHHLISSTLAEMERIRMDADEADSPAEERRLRRRYSALWNSIKDLVALECRE